MITRAEFALLALNGLVIHAHVHFDRCHIFMSEQFLQTEWIASVDQVANGKGMPQNMRTDPFASDLCAFLESIKEQRHAIFREWKTRFREEEVIFSMAAPLGQFFLIWSVMIQVEEQIALTVLSHGNAPFFGPFPPNREHALFAVHTAPDAGHRVQRRGCLCHRAPRGWRGCALQLALPGLFSLGGAHAQKSFSNSSSSRI